MTHQDLHAPFRTPTDAYRLEALGFYLAKQVITPEARTREERDEAFRLNMVPLRDLLRPHVFSERAARDAACKSPMPGGVFALKPVAASRLASELAFHSRTACLFAIGNGFDDDGFDDVASAIADPEMVGLVERRVRGGRPRRTGYVDSIVLTVSGTHYRILIDEAGIPEVRAKSPFGVVSEDEVTRTGEWLVERLAAMLDYETRTIVIH